MDAPRAFFFNLERKNSQQKTTCHLCRTDGSTLTDPTEMRKPYSAEISDMDCAADLFAELPQLGEEQRKDLDNNHFSRTFRRNVATIQRLIPWN
ncbi:DAB adaptor protein 1a [Tachysurus ichikawai]